MPESIKEQLTRTKAELDAEIAKEKAAVVTGASSPLLAPSFSAPANKKFSKGVAMAARIGLAGVAMGYVGYNAGKEKGLLEGKAPTGERADMTHPTPVPQKPKAEIPPSVSDKKPEVKLPATETFTFDEKFKPPVETSVKTAGQLEAEADVKEITEARETRLAVEAREAEIAREKAEAERVKAETEAKAEKEKADRIAKYKAQEKKQEVELKAEQARVIAEAKARAEVLAKIHAEKPREYGGYVKTYNPYAAFAGGHVPRKIEKAADNPYKLSTKTLEKVDEVYSSNIEKIFPNDTLKSWRAVKDQSAYDLMRKTESEIEPSQKFLHSHLKTLQETTGLKPVSGIRGTPESIEKYMERVLQYAASKSKTLLEALKLQ